MQFLFYYLFLQYLPKCDQVMLLHEGRVVETGPHSQLLGTGAGPLYTELYQLYQSKYEKIQRHRLLSCMGPSQDGDGQCGMLLGVLKTPLHLSFPSLSHAPVCLLMHASTHAHIHPCIHPPIQITPHAHTHPCTCPPPPCTHPFMHTSLCAHPPMYLSPHAHIYLYTHPSMCTSTHAHIHPCAHHPFIHVHIHPWKYEVQSGLAMPLSRHSVGTYWEMSSHATRLLSHCGLILA